MCAHGSDTMEGLVGGEYFEAGGVGGMMDSIDIGRDGGDRDPCKWEFG